jgi:transcriptional regulator with GAF, ATPase, and Fis domain
MEDVERQHIKKSLEITHWRISGAEGAAKLLDMNASTLRSRIKKLKITRES